MRAYFLETRISHNQSERESSALRKHKDSDDLTAPSRRTQKSLSTYTIYTSESAKSSKTSHVELFWRDPKLGLEVKSAISNIMKNFQSS